MYVCDALHPRQVLLEVLFAPERHTTINIFRVCLKEIRGGGG